MEHEDNSPHENHEHSEHHESRESHHEKKDMTEKLRTNPWIISTFVLGILGIILIVTSLPGMGITGNVISEDEAGELALNFFNNKLSNNPGTLTSIEEVSGIYKVGISVQGEEIFLYFTRDGKWINQGSELVSIIPQKTTATNVPTTGDIPKADKPVVELFVVSYCPYGIGAEKGFLPVMELLKDKADLQITFMHTQHGEKEDKENKLQICLREEQADKDLDYLGCFLEDGDSERCLVQAKIDKAKLDTCLSSKIEEYHLEDISSTEKYGITGSPSLIVNGVKANIPQLKDRTPANFLSIICSAFNEAPEECSNILSSEIQSPEFGYSSDSDPSSGGQC